MELEQRLELQLPAWVLQTRPDELWLRASEARLDSNLCAAAACERLRSLLLSH